LLKKYAWRIISVNGDDIMERIQKRKNAVAFADSINSIEGVPPSPIARRLSGQWQQKVLKGKSIWYEDVHDLPESLDRACTAIVNTAWHMMNRKRNIISC